MPFGLGINLVASDGITMIKKVRVKLIKAQKAQIRAKIFRKKLSFFADIRFGLLIFLLIT